MKEKRKMRLIILPFSIRSRDVMEGSKDALNLEGMRTSQPNRFKSTLLAATNSTRTDVNDIISMAAKEYPNGTDPRLEPKLSDLVLGGNARKPNPRVQLISTKARSPPKISAEAQKAILNRIAMMKRARNLH